MVVCLNYTRTGRGMMGWYYVWIILGLERYDGMVVCLNYTRTGRGMMGW